MQHNALYHLQRDRQLEVDDDFGPVTAGDGLCGDLFCGTDLALGCGNVIDVKTATDDRFGIIGGDFSLLPEAHLFLLAIGQQ